SSLKGDFDGVFDVFKDLLHHPDFREEKVSLAKSQLRSVISRRNDDIGGIASREAAKLGYGADSPYVRQAEYWTIDAVTREDLLAWHNKYTHPNNIILGLAGDFDSKQMEAKLRQAFDSWPKGPVAEKLDVQFQNPKPGINFIAKDDVNQSNITLVAMGTKRNDPDYYAIRVMNELFGGGDSARLYNNIRTKKGLAYSVGGGIGANYDYPGLFRISMGTKSETTAEAVQALFDEIERLDKEPPTVDEVSKAKASLLNSFIFNFDSKVKVLSEKMGYEFYGYPQDFIDKFRPGIERITPADVSRVVKKFVDRKRFAVLVVGKAADFDKPLSTFGAVNTIDVTIPTEPPSGGKAASKSIESNPAGKELVAKIANALGGQEKIAAIKSVSQSATQTLKTPRGDIAIEAVATTVYPESSHVVMQTPMGEMVSVITPAVAFRAMGGQSQALPDSMKEEQLKDLRRDLISILQHANDPTYKFSAGEREGTTWLLDIDANGALTKWYVDDSGKIVKASFKTTSQAGPVQRVVEYSDYRSVEGINFPFTRLTKDNGSVVAEGKVKEIKLNPAVDPKIFQKP
ncbi:MAG TPA: pitrilysin family protein, partial [Terriglobales bacterium]|nr:pitrilysin family protein [Terriglobales bacterium]